MKTTSSIQSHVTFEIGWCFLLFTYYKQVIFLVIANISCIHQCVRIVYTCTYFLCLSYVQDLYQRYVLFP